jgi:hypothetical protein
MLFMVMHKATEANDNVKPDATLIAEMGALIGEARANGTFRNGAGLRPRADRIRLNVKGGKVTRTDGPLKGGNELVAGFAMLKVHSMDEAVEWATRFAEVVGDVEIDVGPVVEPWDLGLMEKPANAPLRVLSMHKADAASEAGTPPTPELMQRMERLIESMKDAGVFLAGEGLKPSALGARLRTSGGRHTWTDGPFSETKELIGGFTMLELNSLQEAKAWTDRYADILGDVEVDVREVFTGGEWA